MMYDHEKSDPAIVAVKPTNKAGQPAAELVEPRAEAEENASQQSTGTVPGNRVTGAEAHTARCEDIAKCRLYTRGGRSYGAGGGGHGTFIVHTN